MYTLLSTGRYRSGLRPLAGTLIFALSGFAMPADNDLDAAPDPGFSRYENAFVFDGEIFERRPLCVRNQLIASCNGIRGQTINLGSAFVTPPFGDAHTHRFDGPFGIDAHTRQAFATGAFYAMTMTARTSLVAMIRPRLSGPGNVDVASSTGGITGPESHPAEIYEALAIGAYSYEDQLARADAIRASRRVADDAYYVVETPADLEEKWPMILAGKPDFIKVYLRKSARYDEGFGKWGAGGGINPDLLPLIREKSRAAGLRLAVANSSIHDFHASLDAEADIVTHLPCYQDTGSDTDSPYYHVDTAEECLISAEQAEKAAAIDMAAILIVTEWSKERPAETVTWEKQNIAQLEAAGVTLAVGSNAYPEPLTDGLIAGVEKGFFEPARLLKIATMDTPKLIFPDRTVGCLQIGCEASFIAFASDPIANIRSIRSIVYRLKDAQVIDVHAARAR